MKQFDEWRIHNVTLNNENNNYFNDSADFYKLLKAEHFNHITQSKDAKNSFREISLIKSPMTIFNGNWGSGKTFYIENFIKNFPKIKELDEDKYFDDVLYLDSLELLSSEDLIFDSLISLTSLSKKFSKVKAGLIKIKNNKIFKTGMEIANQFIANNIKINITEVIQNIKNDYPEGKTLSLSLKEPIIVFIDNLERMGKDSSEIVKLIYKLRKIDNLFFVLITNIDKLKNVIINDFDSEIDDEYPIYKFVNTKIFNFNQNYIPFITNLNPKIGALELSNLNRELNNGKDGLQLSIREFSHWADFSEFSKVESDIDRLLTFKSIPYINIDNSFKNIYSKEISIHINRFKELVNLLEKISNSLILKLATFSSVTNYNIEHIAKLFTLLKKFKIFREQEKKINNQNLNKYVDEINNILIEFVKTKNEVESFSKKLPVLIEETRKIYNDHLLKRNELHSEINSKKLLLKSELNEKIKIAQSERDKLNLSGKHDESQKKIILIDEYRFSINHIENTDEIKPLIEKMGELQETIKDITINRQNYNRQLPIYNRLNLDLSLKFIYDEKEINNEDILPEILSIYNQINSTRLEFNLTNMDFVIEFLTDNETIINKIISKITNG